MSEVRQVARRPITAGDCKKGTFVIMKNRPVKLIEIKTSKTGKHGHAKCNMTGTCVLTENKVNDVFPASANLVAFTLDKEQFLVTDVDESSHSIEVLTADNDSLTFRYFPDKENCKGAEAVAAHKARIESKKDDDKGIYISVIRAPVEIGENEFKDEELIESFNEAKVE